MAKLESEKDPRREPAGARVDVQRKPRGLSANDMGGEMPAEVQWILKAKVVFEIGF